ncbi:RecQ family ATP-dependent DNA helicase [Arthrobacter citreus]|uniref:RecQ family ATP-dependent DNA helicase n=1 Tax=Arthrobacter TaxID=1663 RepID=UPI00126406E3|nr:RecQ family ATP-dependent DNA helicase [Arthrobacter gandavensis]
MSITRQDLLKTAADMFGWDTFRDGQLEAMEAVTSGRDALCVMPTGYGKSGIYQVPALTLPGVAVVVSPLIALQRDQADAINEAAGLERAYVLNSTQAQGSINDAWAAAQNPDEKVRAKFLFLAPEQLAREEVMDRLLALDVSLLVIDEAHCVSSWGHDFRPDYLQLGTLVQALGRPVLALTATAAPPVRSEILTSLNLRNPLVLAHGFDRPNLHLAVQTHVSAEDKRRAVLESVPELPGPGLLYVATRRETEDYASGLVEQGMRAESYHSSRRAKDRQEVHRKFLDDEVDVVAATSAFGMGIDKPNVRFVVHAAIPDSIDSYYQEIGRGGRDGEPAHAVLHYRPEDLGLRRFFASKAPDADGLAQLFAVLRTRDGGVTAAELRTGLGISSRKLGGLLNLLRESGAVMEDSGVYRAGTMSPEEAVDAAVAFAQRREHIDQSRVDMARQYAETTGCRREFLLGYFGEQLGGPCGNCDNCEKAAAQGETVPVMPEPEQEPGVRPFPLQSPVAHSEWGPGMVMSYDDGTVTVLFESEGYKTLSVDLVLEKDLLRPAGAVPEESGN